MCIYIYIYIYRKREIDMYPALTVIMQSAFQAGRPQTGNVR